MVSDREENSVSGVTGSELKRMYRMPQELENVKRLLQEAEEQSKRKEIKIIREVRPLRNKLIKWKIMFYYGIHWSKPFYPVRIARNILLSKLYRLLRTNRYVFRGCEFALTFKCNFKCSHCLCARIDESETRKELEPEDYRRIVKEAMKIGATTFGMEGGEPFVKKNWDKIIEVCRPKYNHIIISTNGSLFDEEKAKKCAELGVDTINFSLDSGIPELHDVFRRRKGSFESVVNGIRLCKKYKIKVVLNSVVSKYNLYTEGFRRLLEFGEKEKVMVNILFAKSIGSFKDDRAMLDEDDFRAYEKIVEPYAYACIHHDTQVKYNYGNSGCHGTKEMTNFTPYGDVMNCANMHIYFGNVREEPLAEIRKRALAKTPFGRYRPCFLAMDKDFMNIYYPLLERKTHVSLEEFTHALKEYEVKHNRLVYPELHS